MVKYKIKNKNRLYMSPDHDEKKEVVKKSY